MLKRVWRKGNPLALLVGIQLLWRTVWRVIKKLEIKPPCDPIIPLLGIYPEKTITENTHCSKIHNSEDVEVT